MFPKFLTFPLAFAAVTPVLADVPRVATDITPVHSLVAQVMAGVGAPDLIVKPGANPHGYALRPSQARALQNADLVVWMGEGLTPWLEKPLDTLAGSADVIELMGADATHVLPYREGHHDDHDEHGHDDEHADHDDEHSDEHAEHDEHDEHDDHGDEHADHGDEHGDHEGADPHAWLDPDNAIAWLDLIADQLSLIDPEHGDLYAANAAAGQERIRGVVTEVSAMLAPMKNHPFAAFHDAYQYFEVTFDLTLAGTVALGDASDPSPAQLDELRTTLEDKGVDCAFTEPQLNSRLLIAAAEGKEIKIFELDPLGAALEPGPNLYPELLKAMGASMEKCIAH